MSLNSRFVNKRLNLVQFILFILELIQQVILKVHKKSRQADNLAAFWRVKLARLTAPAG